MGKRTILSFATSKGDSFRTTVPKNIVNQFNLKVGDMLEWNLVVKDGKMGLEIYPIKEQKNEPK